MRKTILGLALAAFSSVPAHAFFEANVAAGYTMINLADINALMVGGTNVTEIKSGTYLSADAGVSMMPFVKLSPRVVAVFANQGSLTTGGSSKATVDSNIVIPELGLAFDLGVPMSGISARAGVWAGYGMATVATMSENSGLKTTSLFQGSGFSAEALAALRYSIVPFLSLSLEAGYRLANMATLKDTAGKDWKNFATNKAIGADFSGANIGGGLTFSF